MSRPRSFAEAARAAPTARLDPALRAKVLSRTPLRYRRGADARLDRPAHVRASSALCWVGAELVVLQDDAAFLGVVDPASGLVDDVPLPASASGHRVFDARRGNKADKPDFELAFGAGETLFALGSGGLAARQRVLTWRRGEATGAKLVALPRLYAHLREHVVGEANLNFEGAALLGDQVVLANRGGDGSVGGMGGSPDALVRFPLAALVELLEDPDSAALPELRVERVELGGLPDTSGALHALRFTELSPRSAARGGGLWYLAAAEQTDNFYDDGQVVGSAIGIVRFADDSRDGAAGGDGGAVAELRYAPICEACGELSGDKVEGVCEHARPDRLWAVTDPDDPDRPGELLELELSDALGS